jgi:hypothetical protein
MKKVIFAVLLVVALSLVLVTPIFADQGGVPNGGNPDKPPVNIGQTWSNGVDPGLRDESVHASQDAAALLEEPVGQYFKDANAGLIPGHNK